MNREDVDKWCERGILYLVLAIMVFAPLATGAVRTLEFLTIQALTLGVMVLWLVRLWLSPKPQMLWTPLCWAVLAFVAYAIWRYTAADIEYVARQELVHILVYAFLFFAILNNLYRQESTQIITFTMVGLAMLISCYAIYQYLTGSDQVWYFTRPEGYKGRGSGTYICPNNLAGFLEMLLPLALSYTLISRVKSVGRILLGYAALVMAVGMASTVSRGGWAACGLALMAFFCVLAANRNYRLPAVLLLVTLLASGSFFVVKTQPFKKRFADPPNPELGSFSDAVVRYDLWEGAVTMWQDHVWLGVGPGHYDHQFRIYRPASTQRRPDRAHNEYLNTLADWGVAGAAIVAAALTALFVGVGRTWKIVRRSDNTLGTTHSNKFAFVVGATFGLVALLLHAVVDFNLQIPANAILATALMALLNGHLRFATERYWMSARLPLKLLFSTGLVAGLVYLGGQEWRHGREYVWLDRAENSSLYSDQQIGFLKKAFAVEPMNYETSYQIGEAYRTQAWEGSEDYPGLAQTAMEWYARGWKINPLSAYNYLRYGMCLDWTGKQPEAEPYYNRADALDPNSYYVAAHMGWHYVQTGNYAAAKVWFLRSKQLLFVGNEIANNYYDIVQRRLLDAALSTNTLKWR